MSGKLREYHDALVRIDARNQQLIEYLQLIRAEWDEYGEQPDILGPIDHIANRMDEIIPDAAKATRATRAQRAAAEAPGAELGA